MIDGVKYMPINQHITKSANREIKYLVIHYTAGGSSVKGKAESTRLVWIDHKDSKGNLVKGREASADFIVDDETMIQANPDPRNYYCWAVGDGKGKYGITNKDCISIEICSNLKKGTSVAKPNHEGWYFTEESLANAVKLAKALMVMYNIPIERVIRHWDASRKSCPGLVGWNKNALYDSAGQKQIGVNNESEWIKFKQRLVE